MARNELDSDRGLPWVLWMAVVIGVHVDPSCGHKLRILITHTDIYIYTQAIL